MFDNVYDLLIRWHRVDRSQKHGIFNAELSDILVLLYPGRRRIAGCNVTESLHTAYVVIPLQWLLITIPHEKILFTLGSRLTTTGTGTASCPHSPESKMMLQACMTDKCYHGKSYIQSINMRVFDVGNDFSSRNQISLQRLWMATRQVYMFINHRVS